MTYEEALALVRTKYRTIRDSNHAEIIQTGMTYDGCNGFCVALYNDGERVYLTDFGETKEVFDEVSERAWESLCKKNGFEFNHWHIEHSFSSIKDISCFIAFLDRISKKYFPV